MKALALKPGSKDVYIKDLPDPNIKNSHQVKIKVHQVGICGTDREEVSGGRANAPKGENELIIGHEMMGEVIGTGKQVSHLKVGDPVVLTVRRGCGKCAPCKAGCFDMCETGQYEERGIKGRHGYDAQIVVEDEEYVLKIPKKIADIAVLTEPTSVVEKAIEEACKLQCTRLPKKVTHKQWLKKKNVLVAGLGPIGLLATMILRLRGANVYGLDIVDPKTKRIEIFQEMKGNYIQGNNHSLDTLQKECPQIDMIVEAAGIAKLDFDLIKTLGYNGIYVLTGVPGDERPLNVDGAAIMRQLVLKNQVILGSVNASFENFSQAIKDLSSAEKKWPKLLQQMITSKTPFTEFQNVLFEHTPDEIKAILLWD